MNREFVRFQELFTFVASSIIWNGFLSRFYCPANAHCKDKRIFIELRMNESLEFLKDNLSTVVHGMKYLTAKGPLVGTENDFTDISNLSHYRTRQEAVATINELMLVVKPEKLLFENNLEAMIRIRGCLCAIAGPPVVEFYRPIRKELSEMHVTAVAEIIYVHFFDCQEHDIPEEITPEMEDFIRNIYKPLLAGVMYGIKPGYADVIDFFLGNLNSWEQIKENPAQLFSSIEAKMTL